MTNDTLQDQIEDAERRLNDARQRMEYLKEKLKVEKSHIKAYTNLLDYLNSEEKIPE